jgi:uncharacterized protein (UPF0332 family)
MDTEWSWKNWFNSGRDSLLAAQLLEKHGHIRSCLSRAYYASYHASTAILIYSKQLPPVEREAWSHSATPDLVRNLPASIWQRDTRNRIAQDLSRLYDLRILADYNFDNKIDSSVVDRALKSASYIVRTISRVVITGE